MSQLAERGESAWLAPRRAVTVFLAFALAYFLSTLIRAVTATLSPVLNAELSLQARDLGLLAGGYFLGFALTQLPLGAWLDRFGPRRVILAFLTVAVVGCAAFASATSFAGLLTARVLTGMGVSACLMAPLTGYRRWLRPADQLRANSWMLMTGSLGMVASTLPVQWLLPLIGWRGLFWGLAGLVALSMLVLLSGVPRWPSTGSSGDAGDVRGYADILRHPFFRMMLPIGFFNYAGMLAMQTLWAGPWMVKVCGATPQQAAFGLFAINLTMLGCFWLWGLVNPALARRGLRAEQLIAGGLPLSFAALAAVVLLGPDAGWPLWALFCASSTFVSLSQPAVAMAMPAQAAGRALSAYNLVIFAGVFVMQWAIGGLIDLLAWLGQDTVTSFRGAVAVFGLCGVAAYIVFLSGHRRLRLQAAG
ncbi:MAG: MFS transporter [Hydrogenophaga sp.]|nr:MFS transporter [Hydrogenophaga sp.]